MEWAPGDRSNIEDRRGAGMMGGYGVHIGLGGFVVLLVIGWLTGVNPLTLLNSGDSPPDGGAGYTGAPNSSGPITASPAEEKTVDFVDSVANDVQDTWASALGSRYQRTKVVLFRDAIDSACGTAESATGPFYCPSDEKVYLDLGFFDDLSRRFGAPGDFAKAYVIAHEFGHHIQHLTGLDANAGSSRTGPQSASVALELQADCFAGVWGHAASLHQSLTAGHVVIQPGDEEQALNAASAIGDDRLQREATGRVMPERFTHGTSAQRVAAFRRGMDSGDPGACATPRH